MADFVEKAQQQIFSDRKADVEDSVYDISNRSKLNDVINLYRRKLDMKYSQIGDTIHFPPSAASKLSAVSDDVRKEITEDMLDWETYMYCKENEERSKAVQQTYLPIRNEGRSDIVIKAFSKNFRNNLHNNAYYGNPNGKFSIYEVARNTKIDRENAEDAEQLAYEEKLRGNKCFKEENYEEACQHYTKSLNIYPIKDVFNNRAMAYIKLKNFTAALKDANEVLKIDPTNEKALYRKVTSLKEMRLYQEALRDIENHKSLKKKSLTNLWNDIQNEMTKLNGKKYNIRPYDGSRRAFEIDISQLSAYANFEESYLLEADKTGCTRSCVCGYCTEEERRNRTRSSGLRIKDRDRWKPLTNALLKDMRIIPTVTNEKTDFNKDTRREETLSYKTANGTISSKQANTCANGEPINETLSRRTATECVRPTSLKNANNGKPLKITDQLPSRQNNSANDYDNHFDVVGRLLEDVKLNSVKTGEHPTTSANDINKKFIAFIKNAEPLSLKNLLKSHFDVNCLTFLLESIVENFQLKKEWDQIYNLLEVVAEVEQFHHVVKTVDESCMNDLRILLDEAECLKLRNAASIKQKYF